MSLPLLLRMAVKDKQWSSELLDLMMVLSTQVPHLVIRAVTSFIIVFLLLSCISQEPSTSP